MQKNEEFEKNKIEKLKTTIESGKKRIVDLDKLFSRIYEDNILGKLDDDRYSRMAKEYDIEQKYLMELVAESEKKLLEASQVQVHLRMLLQGLREFLDIRELTPELVNKLIQRIEIHNNEKKHSHNNVKVDIYFTAVGLVDIPTEQQLIDLMERLKQENAVKTA